MFTLDYNSSFIEPNDKTSLFLEKVEASFKKPILLKLLVYRLQLMVLEGTLRRTMVRANKKIGKQIIALRVSTSSPSFLIMETTGKDISQVIESSSSDILHLIEFQGSLDKLLNKLKDKKTVSVSLIRELEICVNNVAEVIELNYVALRIFKRAVKKTSNPTSQMALETINHSANTISQIINAY